MPTLDEQLNKEYEHDKKAADLLFKQYMGVMGDFFDNVLNGSAYPVHCLVHRRAAIMHLALFMTVADTTETSDLIHDALVLREEFKKIIKTKTSN